MLAIKEKYYEKIVEITENPKSVMNQLEEEKEQNTQKNWKMDVI